MKTNINGSKLAAVVAVFIQFAVGNAMTVRAAIEPSKIIVAGLVKMCACYEVSQEDTFNSILTRAGGEVLSNEGDPRKRKIWPPLYVRIVLKTPVNGKRTLSVPKRLWNDSVSKYATLNNIESIEFVAAY